jgi:nucleoside-diphosphate-sugar epimerase
MFGELSGREVLVTGAAGFIGAHLVAALEKQGAIVHALMREATDPWRLETLGAKPNPIMADLTDFERVGCIVTTLRPDYLFHLAVSRHEGDGPAALTTNVAATLNLLKSAATPRLKRFVHLGSSLEYGKSDRPLREADRLRPDTLYGASKATATFLLQQTARAEGLPVIILRPFYVFGPLEPSKRLIPSAIRAGLKNEELRITAPGIRRDFVYVEDVVRACLISSCVEGLNGRDFNIASGSQWSNEEVVAEIGRILGRRIKVAVGRHKARDWDRPNFLADISAAREMGWKPEYDLHNGLAKTVAWLKRFVS